MKCMACRGQIYPTYEESSVPIDATEFRAIGNTMSAITKDRDGAIYITYVCDECLGKALEDGRAEKSNKWKSRS